MGDRSTPVARILTLVQDCCERAASCRLHLLHSGDLIPAMFHAVRHQHLFLLVPAPFHVDSLHPDALCCVSFPFQQTFCAFLGCITEFETTDAGLEVGYTIPTVIESTNLRRSFRVPIVQDAHVDLSVEVAARGRLSALPVNVSDCGIEAQLTSDEELIAINDPVRLNFRFRNEAVELPGVVRRRQGTRFGFELALPQAPESRERLAAWQRIVRSLEQVWLKNRLS